MSPIRTRVLIISDTHGAVLSSATPNDIPFRPPLPKADVLLHCGDLTMIGRLDEYEKTISMLACIDAELKLIIAGNHDISLDEEYYRRRGQFMHQTKEYDSSVPEGARRMWTEDAKGRGITYLEEGTHSFRLSNGARLNVYASPYQPEFCDWAFPYARNQDRFNTPQQSLKGAVNIAQNPIPDFPAVDVMMTHGPPAHILDKTYRGEPVGCEHLLRAARRCRPRLHCFGHIHEGWGAERITWKDLGASELGKGYEDYVEEAESVTVRHDRVEEERAAYVDISTGGATPLEVGKETLMVNASIMTLMYKPWNGAWLVDMDLEGE